MKTELAATTGAFAMLMRAKAISTAEGIGFDGALEALGTPPEMVSRIKAAVGASSTTSSAELAGANSVVATFIDWLAEASIFARMIADNSMQRVPLYSRLVAFGADIPATVVQEGGPIPVSSLDLTGTKIEPSKVAAMVVATRELWGNVEGSGQAFINRKLADAVTKAGDAALFAALTTSATATETAYVADADGIRDGLRAILDVVHVGAGARLYFAVSPGAANALATLSPRTPELNPMTGELLGVPAMVSSGLNGRRIALVDARGAAGQIDRVQVDASESGTFEMRDDPTDGATTMVSMFQTNSVAVRALLWCAIEPLRDNPLAYLDLEEPSGS